MSFTLSPQRLAAIRQRTAKAALEWKARDAYAVCKDGWHYHKWEQEKCVRCGISQRPPPSPTATSSQS